MSHILKLCLDEKVKFWRKISTYNSQLNTWTLDITTKYVVYAYKVSKAIPVTGRGGLWGCKMLRIPHSLDNRLTDGGKVNKTKIGNIWHNKKLMSISLHQSQNLNLREKLMELVGISSTVKWKAIYLASSYHIFLGCKLYTICIRMKLSCE
jgi:hypothetical protein